MPYRPKIITGKVKDTGLPIDGHVLYFAMWDYDREHWHLYGWEDEHDEAVMLTMFQNETEPCKLTRDYEKAFTEKWKAKQWEPDGAFSLELSQVEVLEVKQEEEKDDIRERLIAGGFNLTPRKRNDTRLTFCLPLDKNLNGNTQENHPDWELVECPGCGQKCWKVPISEKIHEKQEVQYLCTECSVGVGLLAPYNPIKNAPNPGGNRAQRRKTSLAQKRAATYRRKAAKKAADQHRRNLKEAEKLILQNNEGKESKT